MSFKAEYLESGTNTALTHEGVCCTASETILKRMESFEMVTPPQDVLKDWIHHQLLRPSLSDDELKLAQQVFKNHTMVTDDQLKAVLDIGLCDIDRSPQQSSKGFAFYLISATVSYDIIQGFLKDVVTTGDANSPDMEDIFDDMQSLFSYKQGDIKCHVRYIGQCQLPHRNPQIRYKELCAESSTRPASRFNNFIQKRFTDEELRDKVKLYEFVGARLCSGSTRQDADQVEERLIASFDIHRLLNAQTGGYYLNWKPNEAQLQHFSAMNTSFYQKMTATARFKEANVDDWVSCLRRLFDTNDNVIEMIVEQARHATFKGLTIAVMIGSDSPKTAWMNPVPYFVSKSRSAITTRIMLDSLIDAEQGTNKSSTQEMEYFMPLVDVMPFEDIGTVDENIEQLVEYLHVTCPLICITMSRESSSCARSDFCHLYGLPRKGFLDHVGLPSVQHYAGSVYFDNPTMSDPPQGYKTIVIPHIDPGVEKYGSRPIALSAVLYYTWAITFYFMNQAQDLVSSLNDDFDHDTICGLLYEYCSPDSATLPESVKAIYRELQRAKETLSVYWSRTRTNEEGESVDPGAVAELTQATSEAKSLGATKRLDSIGRAMGQPGSEERLDQVAKLWKRQFPDLFAHISRNDRAAWLAWASGVGEGKDYSLSALAHRSNARAAEVSHPLSRLIKDFGPEGCQDDDWMENEDHVRAALSRRSRYMLGGLEGNALIDHMRQLSESRWRRDRLPFHSLLEGSQVKITRNGSLVLRWMDDNIQDEEGRNIIIEMRCFEWIPLELRGEEEMFTLRFLSTGIGLQVNKDFGSHAMSGDFITREGFSKEEAPALIRQRSGFGLHRYAVDLERLWQCERIRMDGTTALLPVNVDQQRQGRSALMSGDDPAKFSLPCHPQDAVYLLQQWLLNDYPEQGGEVTTLNPYKIYTLRSPLPDTRPFEEYIVTHHRSHPFADFWLDLIRNLGNTKNESEILRLNIQAIRQDVTVTRKQTRLRQGNTGIEFRLIKFGRPKQ